MGLFFTLLFVLTAYLSPDTLFGGLAQYHIEVILAVVTMGVSLTSAADSGIMRLPQTYALLGLSVVVPLSIMFNGWFGGGPSALLDFLPAIMPFWFIYLNCKKKGHLQLLVSVLVFAALFLIYHGFTAVRAHTPDSPFYMVMKEDAMEPIYRIRGLSFLNDPNDLAQFIVSIIPFMFFFWGKGKYFRNFVLVLLPVSGLVYGMYLTQSRGGMLALIAVAIFMLRRKIGTVPSIVTGVLIFIALTALGFTGGRDVSASSGEDRMEAWSTGLQLFRSNPVFGVGISQFTDYNDITAHNSVVVCAAELGGTGIFLWFLFLVPTLRDALVGSDSPQAKEEARLRKEREAYLMGPPVLSRASGRTVAVQTAGAALASGGEIMKRDAIRPIGSSFASVAGPARSSDPRSLDPSRFRLGYERINRDVSDEELHRLSYLAMLSFVGFLTAGWFLSRAYTMTLFMNAGVVAVIYRMEQERGIVPERLPIPRAMKYAAITAVAALIVVYIIVRVDHFV